MVDITSEQILRFQHAKIEQGYKPAYCNRFLVLLSFCFNLAIKWGAAGVEKNPVKAVRLIKCNNKIERYLKEDEAFRLLKEISRSPNKMLKYFVPFALFTGARKREILDAKWSDIDLEGKVWIIPTTKSGKPRYVPLIDDALILLNSLKVELHELLMQRELFDIPWVFPNCSTGKPYQSIFNAWDTARRNAGLQALRIHDLRHSFASALVNQGVPIYDVQKLLGHQDIKTTERYAHLSMERLMKSAKLGGAVYASMRPGNAIKLKNEGIEDLG